MRCIINSLRDSRFKERLQWPKEGTFMTACCDEVEANIKHHKARDTSNSRLGKREREALRLFRQEGRKQILNVTQSLCASSSFCFSDLHKLYCNTASSCIHTHWPLRFGAGNYPSPPDKYIINIKKNIIVFQRARVPSIKTSSTYMKT